VRAPGGVSDHAKLDKRVGNTTVLREENLCILEHTVGSHDCAKIGRGRFRHIGSQERRSLRRNFAQRESDRKVILANRGKGMGGGSNVARGKNHTAGRKKGRVKIRVKGRE